MAKRVDERGIDEFGNFMGQTGLDRFFVGVLTHSVAEVRAFLKYYGLEPHEAGVDPEWLFPTQKNRRGRTKRPLIPFGYVLPRGERYGDWRWPHPPTRELRLRDKPLDEQVEHARTLRERARARRVAKAARRKAWREEHASWSTRGKLILRPRSK